MELAIASTSAITRCTTTTEARPLNRTVPLVLAIALFMEHMDSTVISTALPAIATDIGTTPIALETGADGLSGGAGDLHSDLRLGGRPVRRAARLRRAIVVFMIGSIACAVSGSLRNSCFRASCRAWAGR
jgi:MFS family permease